MKSQQKLLTAVTLALQVVASFFITSCNLLGSVTPRLTDAVTILDDAIDTLDSNSKQWQQVLRDTQRELVEAGQSTLSNEVSNLLSKSLSDVGIEAKCYTDFMRDRVKDDLKRIRANLTNESITLKPVFCKPTPSSINFDLVEQGRVNSIEIAGYNLDSANIQVFLDNGQRKYDFTTALAVPSRYLMTLNVGANGVRLTDKSNKIIFKQGQRIISTVNVIQPIKREKEIVYQIPTLKRICPRHIRGDRDFAGHGPNVTASAKIIVKNQRELFLQVYLNAKETQKDWTEAKLINYRRPLNVNLPSQARIISVSPNFSSTSYRDINHQLDSPSISGGSLVNKFEINGDTKGNDVGNCKLDDVYMNIYFNKVRIKYKD